MKPSVVFIVIAFGQDFLVDQCLQNLTDFLPAECQILLFDNHSSKSLKPLALKHKVKYLQSHTNLGFSGGCNFAIESVLRLMNPLSIALVNSDIFIDKDFGKQLPQALKETSRFAAWQPTLYKDQAHTVLENRGILYSSLGIAKQNRSFESETQVLNGAFLFFPQETLRELLEIDGYVFVPDYFFNAEDVELSLRLLQRGKQLKVLGSISAQHLGQQSSVSDMSFLHYVRNLLWTVIIEWDTRTLLEKTPQLLFGQLLLFLHSCLRLKPGLYISALAQTWQNRQRLRFLRVHFAKHSQQRLKAFLK